MNKNDLIQRAVYLGGEWVPVPCCSKCISLDCNTIIDESCGLEISYYDSCSALELIDKNFSYSENKYKHKIEKPYEIKSNCPLPLWDDVRMHPGDEPPTDEHGKKPGRDVLTRCINKKRYDPEEKLFLVCDHDGTDWANAGMYLSECIKVIVWWELPKDDIKGLHASQ